MPGLKSTALVLNILWTDVAVTVHIPLGKAKELPNPYLLSAVRQPHDLNVDEPTKKISSECECTLHAFRL